MMRRKISGQDITIYCQAIQTCSAAVLKQRGSPVAVLSADFIQTYAQWLSVQTKHRYRLVTDNEWLYAALARLDEKTCLLAVSNRWGLHSMARGVEEIVRSGNKIGIRGGNNPHTCLSNGMKVMYQFVSKNTGGRLIREMQ